MMNPLDGKEKVQDETKESKEPRHHHHHHQHQPEHQPEHQQEHQHQQHQQQPPPPHPHPQPGGLPPLARVTCHHPQSMGPDSPHRETTTESSQTRANYVPLSPLHPPTTSNAESSSPALKHRLASATTTPSEALLDRPEKRMRLESTDAAEHDETESWRLGVVPPAYENEWFGQIQHSLSNTYARPRPSSEMTDRDQRSSNCANCHGTEELFGSIVHSLFDLQSELSKLMLSEPLPKASEIHPQEVTTLGLKHSLNWSVRELRNSIRALQTGLSATRPGLPSLANVVSRQDSGVSSHHSLAGPVLSTPPVTTPLEQPRRYLAEPSRSDDYHIRSSDHHSKEQLLKDQLAKHHHRHHSRDHLPALSDSGLPPIFPPSDELRRGQLPDQASLGLMLSPRASSGSSAFGPLNLSPMPQNLPQYRPLPSPGSQYSSLAISTGPSHFSAASSQAAQATQAAQAAHLQDLQHQISTKTLAIQTLQKEHDQLLAAFSRSQIRCNTLDKKSQVSDHEINLLTEEKIRLQQQVESMEVQVQELQKSRDEFQKQSSADGAQWRRIMAMSSQLQAKSAEEARRFKNEREAWEQDKAGLQRRIRDLEDRRMTTTTSSTTISTPTARSQMPASDATSGPDGSLMSMSMEALQQEVLKLRAKCSKLELTLQDLSSDTDLLDRAISVISGIKQKLALD